MVYSDSRNTDGVRRNQTKHELLISRISIHAPLTGCDISAVRSCISGRHFNPRTPDGVRHGNEADYCDIAMWNELGTSNGIPSRPFLRNSVDSNAEQIDKACKDAIKVIAKGGKAEVVLKQLGVMQKGTVQQTISSGDFVPNAPSTVRRKNHNGKGSAKPLIDTGGLRNKVNFVICKKGEYD